MYGIFFHFRGLSTNYIVTVEVKPKRKAEREREREREREGGRER